MDDKIIMDACAYMALWTGERQSDERVLAYVEALRGLRNEQYFSQAVLLLRDRSEHFPKIPEIRDAYREVMEHASPPLAINEFSPMTDSERAAFAGEMRRFMDEWWGSGIGPATDAAGECSDCGATVTDRWAIGPGVFCRDHAVARSKAAATMDIQDLLRDMA